MGVQDNYYMYAEMSNLQWIFCKADNKEINTTSTYCRLTLLIH